jgi:hypothetical protein
MQNHYPRSETNKIENIKKRTLKIEFLREAMGLPKTPKIVNHRGE